MEIRIAPAPSLKPAQPPLAALHGVTKTYPLAGSAVVALRSIQMEIQAGEFAALVGKSGAGKSTLVNLITGIDRPDSGEIVVAGTRLDSLTEDRRARWRGRTLGVVFQFFQLLPSISLEKNVMIPMEFNGLFTPGERRERAAWLLEQVGLAGHIHKRPSEISGGQQQRAAIARALANDPPLIIADEPTGNLDSRTTNEILDLFTQLVESGKTLLVATHDKGVAARADRRIMIVDGWIE